MVHSFFFAAIVCVAFGYQSEYVPVKGIQQAHITSPLPHTFIPQSQLPDSFSWSSVNGTSFLTRSLNQHIPQYCGSCWAHGALSALADRIKIARKAQGVDINLAIQFILNCGTAGSCHGGDHLAVYSFIKSNGWVPFDSCIQYEACSSESTEGKCKYGNYHCSAINTCRTCSTFTSNGGKCVEIGTFPNATVAEYGPVTGADKMKAEIFARGPIACGVNAEPILNYRGGVIDDSKSSQDINHIISIVGWGTDNGKQHWIVRNSWGEYWGELGYFRLRMGQNQLGIEDACAWATPDKVTSVNFPCNEDGSNCVRK